MVDGRYVHGGLSDRLKGITSIYRYCQLHKINYKLYHVYPFRLSDYLEPNIKEMIINAEFISYNSQEAVPVLLNDYQLDIRLHKLYLWKVLRENRGKQIHLYTNTWIYDCNFKYMFNEMFHMSALLNNSVKLVLQDIDGPYVSMVFRFQQLLGDFEEKGYKTLNETERVLLINKCATEVDRLHNLRCSNKLVLITSDSSTFLQVIAHRFKYVRIIPGKVVHMDYTENAGCKTYMKSFQDMMLLSLSEKIYLMQTGEMYHSGFAKRASMINNVEYDEIFF